MPASTVEASPSPPPMPGVIDVREPRWWSRYPVWCTAAVVLILMAVSYVLRTSSLSGQFWIDEAISTGIASHPLGAIPGLLRHDGAPPLFYLLLHFWIQAFGSSESATHALSVLFGLLTIPVGMWAGWSLFGRRAGLMAGVLFAFSAWLTQYAQETRMYELMALLGLIATAALIHAFVYGRRKYLVVFAVTEALMLYTHVWAVFFGVGALLALVPVWVVSQNRRALVRDAALAFIGAGLLFVPWLPNFIYQAQHTGAPWAPRPGLGAPVLISQDLLGGDGVTGVLLMGIVLGLGNLVTRRYWRTRDSTVLQSFIILIVGTLAVAWLASQISPAFVSRYFAPVLGPILLLAAWGCSRSGIVGWLAVALSIVFVIPEAPYVHPYKSDMRDIAGEMAPRLHPGDLVVVAQPEQAPLAWYYLPDHLRYASTIGPVSDPSYMDWVDALSRLQRARPAATLGPLLASLRPGQDLLYIRPITEGAQNWLAPWTRLVRRRAAQWGALLASDRRLREITWAPHYYRGPAWGEANSAILYRKT